MRMRRRLAQRTRSRVAVMPSSALFSRPATRDVAAAEDALAEAGGCGPSSGTLVVSLDWSSVLVETVRILLGRAS
jgi:hypothetical protein